MARNIDQWLVSGMWQSETSGPLLFQRRFLHSFPDGLSDSPLKPPFLTVKNKQTNKNKTGKKRQEFNIKKRFGETRFHNFYPRPPWGIFCNTYSERGCYSPSLDSYIKRPYISSFKRLLSIPHFSMTLFCVCRLKLLFLKCFEVLSK